MRRVLRLKRLLIGAAILLVLIVGMTLGGAWWVGTELLAPAPLVVGKPPTDVPIEVVSIPSDSGSTLAGWFVPALASKGAVVLLHPIRGSRLSMMNRARLFHDAGYAVLLIDFQAHGESPGEHITVGYLEKFDARAAVEWVRVNCPSQSIIVDGSSLGGAAALLASPLNVDAMILESVYPTIEKAVNNRVAMRLPFGAPLVRELLLMQLPWRLGFGREALRPIDFLSEAGCPVLVIAGSKDPLTTLAESQRLFEAAGPGSEMCVVQDAGHIDLFEAAPQQFADAVFGFLKRTGLDHSAGG